MKRNVYLEIEKYMHECMSDSAHDIQHVYRVLYSALDIAKHYDVDMEILIASALLHDIGREAQFKNSDLDHAIVGADMAYQYLISIGWMAAKSGHVKECIATHRYRNNNLPASIEAKIIYDADKLDVIGTLGIARTLLYHGVMSQPLYSVDQNGNVLDGNEDNQSTFFKEYAFKLKNVHNHLFTTHAKEIAEKRRKAGVVFFNDIYATVNENHQKGLDSLKEALIL